MKFLTILFSLVFVEMSVASDIKMPVPNGTYCNQACLSGWSAWLNQDDSEEEEEEEEEEEDEEAEDDNDDNDD